MKKILLTIITFTTLNFGLTAQNVNIPDANFKAYLVGNSSINTNMDTEIQVSEANAFSGTIVCTGQGINDLTGIEAFTALTELFCANNNLSTLNLSQNIALTQLACEQNNMTSLDISQNTNLASLSCHQNSLNTIDVSQNIALTDLRCYNNNLSSLDVSQNTALTILFCNSNNLTTLDVSQNTALIDLTCGGNNLSSLDLSQNLALLELNCGSNNFNTLDISQNTALVTLRCSYTNLSTIDVSQNTALDKFYCISNNFTTLDFSQNTALTTLYCWDNDLMELNLKNINPSVLTNFISTDNPNLTCIEVDDVAAATLAWNNIDPIANFSLDCSINVSSITVQGQAGASTISTLGGTLQMEADVLPLNADDNTYTWSISNGTGSASIDVSGLLTAMSDGTVTVTATANDGSGITGSTIITISNQVVNIKEKSILNNLFIYPNPVNDQIMINTQEEIYAVTILDNLGKTIKTIIQPNPTTAINVSDLAKGIYFLQIQVDDTLVSKKIVKE